MMKKRNFRFFIFFDLSDTLAPVEIEPDWAERLLYEFGLGYFSQLEAAEKIFAGFLNTIITKVFSECLVAFNVSVDYLYGLPYNVNQTGVLMDAAKMILNSWHRQGNITAQRNFQLLYGYEGSFLEHNIFELWFNLPSISAVKALQIAKSEGIEIYDINSGNINQILPLLEVSEDVKIEIQNAVRQGFEVKISQREIQYYDWKGVGYIIRDPETKAGAYKISGGYAGGAVADATAVYIKHLISLNNTNKKRAYFLQGNENTYTEDIDFLTDWVTNCYSKLIANNIGYMSVLLKLQSKNDFLMAVQDTFTKIIQFMGHGVNNYDTLINNQWVGPLVAFEIASNVWISKVDLENVSPKANIKFAYLGSCYSADYEHQIGSALGSLSEISWEGKESIIIVDLHAWAFWTLVYATSMTIGEIYNSLFFSPIYKKSRFRGDPSVNLKEEAK